MLGAELRTTMGANEPQTEGRGDVMKKLLVILCVLVLLALLAVPAVADALSYDAGLPNEFLPPPGLRPPPGNLRGAEAPSPAQMARGGCRAPSA